MFPSFLFLHSAFRSIVLAASIVLFLRMAYGAYAGLKFSPADQRALIVFDQVFGAQILLGISIWVAFSPFRKIAFASPAELFKNGGVLFWAARHPLTMLVAFGAWHTGRARAKRGAPEKRFAAYAITLGAVLLMIVSAIPWPWLSYGRPLVRFTF